MKFFLKTIVFEGLAGCVREREQYRTNLKIVFKIIPNRWEIDARLRPEKDDAKIIEKYPTMQSQTIQK